MLKLENIVIKYKKKTVLSEVNLNAVPGEIIGLLGANGSGKSTLLSVIAGAKKTESGELSINNISFFEKPDEYRKYIGYVPQENPLIAELSCMDNLRIWSKLGKDEMLELISTPPLSILGVHEFWEKKVKDLSGGMKKRLSITATLITNPSILLMDEPFAALDMVAKHDILQYMSTFKAAGGTMIVASHDESVLDYCDRIYFIHDGHVSELDKSFDKSYIDLLRGN
ncbi:MAG: ABC transporter ATP-binding protein [Lachnospiraceae bacterium]|nr:ABC transporter ATP-binding protein [Lachnospiraceae bacterium]